MAPRDLELDVTGVAAGGDGIAREESGRVVFLAGAIPGDRVRAALVEQRRDFSRGRVDEVLAAAPHRVVPPCPFVAAGCGGCDWQHVDPPAQPVLKLAVVRDALARIAKLPDAVVELGPPLPAWSYRTTMRGVSLGGRFALRERHSHDLVAIGPCPIAHPLVEELIVDGTFPDGSDVTLRAGARTGERLAVVAPSAEGAQVPNGTVLVGADELQRGRRAWFHDEVAGRRWRVSARSFFQARPDGAEVLVDLVRAALHGAVGDGDHVVDLYAGVGLFAATVAPGARVTAVEHSASAVADAVLNLATDPVKVLRIGVDRWRPAPAAAVVADPPRTGLGKQGVQRVVATGASRVVLVSCDPASLARDVRLLVDHGYAHRETTLVDLFPQTSHVEAVTRFDHPSGGSAP